MPGVDNVSVQTLVDNIVQNDSRTKHCYHCRGEQPHDVRKEIISLPRTLFIVLSRYSRAGNLTKCYIIISLSVNN